MERVMGKVFIQTYGCQMNEYDTDKMFELLGTQNYTPASSMDEADLVLLNTCSVRDKAEQKVYSELGRMRRLKKQNPNLKIGVGGCVAQQEGIKILKRAENVDLALALQRFLPNRCFANGHHGRSRGILGALGGI